MNTGSLRVMGGVRKPWYTNMFNETRVGRDPGNGWNLNVSWFNI